MNSDLKEAFIKIIQTNQGLLNSLCYLYFKNKEDQKDARQEIILQLWKAFPNFRKEAKVSTWIYKVALNTILNMLRKSKKIPPEKNNLIEDGLFSTPLMDDDIQQLQHFISLLKTEDKALVILHLEGYKNKEIASILTTTSSNVSTRFHRIKKRLKKLYKLYTNEPK